jgi:predicted O-linked N-acetylglucosamine transferase (SPINDLY family)
MYRNLGIALCEAGSAHELESLSAFRQAIAIDPHDIESLNWLAGNAAKRRDWEGAESLYSRSLQLRDSLAVRLARLMARQHLAAWDDWDAELAVIKSATPSTEDLTDPLKVMFVLDDPIIQRSYAEAFATYGHNFAQRSPERHAVRVISRGSRLSIGYLSYDIRRHPVAQLIAGVLEHHDRSLFEVTVHALGPDSTDIERRRIASACERFENHHGRSELQSIEVLRRAQHDIVIDLMGYTRDARPGILLARTAPVQVGWLGYPGTLGKGVLDVLIADPYVIPSDAEAGYAEEILRMPNCYLPADRTRRVHPALPRSNYGLRDDDIVVSCFCQPQKITPVVFDLWLNAMRANTKIVLWLFDTAPPAVARLRARAKRHGVSPDRIHFAGFVEDHADHLARYAVADFAVDTYPYGSHTTAIDALWAGCPLIAYSGAGFASRVSGSVLRAAGLPELVASSDHEYLELIGRLTTDSALRHRLRARLLETRNDVPLYDVGLFTQHYEGLLQKAARRADRQNLISS